MDLDDSDIVFVRRVHKVTVYPYFRHHEIQRPRLVRSGEVVLAEAHYDVARLVPGKKDDGYEITVSISGVV